MNWRDYLPSFEVFALALIVVVLLICIQYPGAAPMF
jgi:hypothetical protein